jgi:hypothetical protein
MLFVENKTISKRKQASDLAGSWGGALMKLH